jgi:GTPase SAR1 family protein
MHTWPRTPYKVELKKVAAPTPVPVPSLNPTMVPTPYQTKSAGFSQTENVLLVVGTAIFVALSVLFGYRSTKQRVRKSSEPSTIELLQDPLLDPEQTESVREQDDTVHDSIGAPEAVPLTSIPVEIANQGKEAIQAYNTALLSGKERLHTCKLMFVGQERVGKTSLLRNLTSQDHDPNQLTTDGADVCVVETSQWIKLDQEPLFPSKFDQSVAQCVGGKLANRTNQQQHFRKWKSVLSATIILIVVVLFVFTAKGPHVSIAPPVTTTPPSSTTVAPFNTSTAPATTTTSAPSTTKAPPATMPPSSTTAAPLSTSAAPVTAAPVTTIAPSPPPTSAVPETAATIATVLLWSAVGLVCIALCACFVFKMHSCITPVEELEGMLQTSQPMLEVLQKMPVDLIVQIMEGGTQQQLTFSTWDFAGQQIYYSVHSLFITGGVYIIVFSMKEAQESSATFLEYLAFWMNSVHAHTSDATDYHILIVGTHRDVIFERKHHFEISELIRSAFGGCEFWAQVHEAPVEENSDQQSLCFFPIDNTLESQVRTSDKSRAALHGAINTLGQQLVDSKNNEYPLRWLHILDELHQKAANGTNFMLKSKSGLAQVAGSRNNMLQTVVKKHGAGRTPQEYATLCTFLSEVGSFLTFNELLIIKPQWIADILFAVVTRPEFQASTMSENSHLQQQWVQFKRFAVLTDELLALLWSRFNESPPLLIDIMLNYDLMFELPSGGGSDFFTSRRFLVPAMLRDASEFAGVVDIEFPPESWLVSGSEPACFLVFEQGTPEGNRGRGLGFIPEGLWFALLVKCARWAQHTDLEWAQQYLATSFRRDVARFSFGAQTFELRLHRAQNSIRLLVLGDCCKYPRGVLERVRAIVDDVLVHNFPSLQYFVALRVHGTDSDTFVDLDTAILQVDRRHFCSARSFISSTTSVGSQDSGMMAVAKGDLDAVICLPWGPPDDMQTTDFDVYLCHCEADRGFATKCHDCLTKYNSASGGRIRVFLRDVSVEHTSNQVTATVALLRSSVFVPVVSMNGLRACGSVGKERIGEFQKSPRWQAVALEYFLVVMTGVNFVSNLAFVLEASQSSVGSKSNVFEQCSPQDVFIFSMVLPRLLNLMLLGSMVRKEYEDNTGFAVWILQNQAGMSVIGALACLRLDNIMLLKSIGIGKHLFSVLPPISIALVNRTQAWGLVTTFLLGDLPQFVVAVSLFRAQKSLAGILPFLQICISAVLLTHQVIQRGLAFIISSPQAEQQWVEQRTETGQLLDCMVADHCMRNRRRNRKQMVMLPLVLEEACLNEEYSSDPIPGSVMEAFGNLQLERKSVGQVGQDNNRLHTGALLSGIVRSENAVWLWDGGGLPVDGWNLCELAAQEIVGFVDGCNQASSTAAVEHYRPLLGRSKDTGML